MVLRERNGPLAHLIGVFGTASFPKQFSRSQRTRAGEQREDTEQNDPSRSHWQKLPGITPAMHNSKYLGFGRCSDISIIREVLCFFFQALLFESHPTFGKTNFYAGNFLPSFLGFKKQQPSFILIYFFSRHPPGWQELKSHPHSLT